MLFVMHMLDKPGSLQLRLDHRPAHKEYVAKIAHRLAFGGPLLDDQGQMTGSVIIVEFEDRLALNQWLADEPYTKCGVYAKVQVHQTRSYWPQRAGFPEA